ncbi:hypothetical protein IID62_00045 [candidate division KSB1 bacterium]|nr:hypothetical protein [candidate division KSB1 bacterium]
MDELKINVGKPVASILSEDAIDFVWVPEPLEDVRERNFERQVNKAIKEKLPVLVQQKIDELQPNLHKEKEQEYQRGFSEGENAGKQSEQERLQELKDNISNTIKEIIDYRKQIIKEAETTIVTLALNFAKNIVGEEIRTNREIIQNQVKKSLEYIIGEGKLIFHVHPDDESQFDDKDQFIPKEYLGAIEIVTDENITRGGCLLETNSGTIDSTIEAKIDELGKSIKIGLEQDLNE